MTDRKTETQTRNAKPANAAAVECGALTEAALDKVTGGLIGLLRR